MWHYPEVLALEKLYTNDTHQVAQTYGIEAAGKIISAVSLWNINVTPNRKTHPHTYFSSPSLYLILGASIISLVHNSIVKVVPYGFFEKWENSNLKLKKCLWIYRKIMKLVLCIDYLRHM